MSTDPSTEPPAEPTTRPPTEPGSTEPGSNEPGATEPGATEPATEPAARGRWASTRFWVIGGVALACLALVVAGFTITFSDRDGPADTAVDSDDHTISAPIEGRDEAEFHLVSGANVVTVRTEAMGDTLYRASTPPDGDSVPRAVDRDGRIELHLADTGEPGPSSLEVTLSTQVRWTILRFSGGATEQVVDLTGGTVSEIDFTAGAARIELTLPVPEGTVLVRVVAGAGDLVVHPPADVPVRATLNSGAGQAVIDGETHSGISPGTVFTPDDWEQAEDRYDIDSAGLGQLTISPTEGS